MFSSSAFIRNQSKISVIVKISDDVDKILIYCGFNISSNRKDISEDVFESFEDIISLTEKYIGLVPAQDVRFFYTRSHLSALENCALVFSTIV